jgi:uncharacterized protein with HEPN domain
MKKEYSVYLEDIIKAMDKIEDYIEGLSLEELREDTKTFEAVIWNFTVLGEAVKGVPEEVRAQAPEIPWKEMAGMRDKLIHQYSEIDINIVWEAIQKRFKQIKPQLMDLLDR